MRVTKSAQRTTVSGSQGELLALALSGGGALIATAGEDQTTRVWDSASGREIAAVAHEDDEDKVRLLAFSPDASLILTGHAFDLEEDILESPGRRVGYHQRS